MFSLFGSSIAALFPSVLLGIPLSAAALLYLYRRRGTSRDTVVSTLFLLQKLPEQLSARRRFIPPLQFWIDLCILTLLFCAVSDMRTTKLGKKIAVVIDNSLSMSARSEPGTTRLDAAKKRASTDLLTAQEPSRYTLFSANSTIAPLSEANQPSSELSSPISNLQPSYSRDDLEAQIKGLLNSAEYDAIWVYTDHPLGDVPSLAPVRVTTISDERSPPATNLWISSIDAQQEGSAWQLSATIASSASIQSALTPIKGSLVFQCYTATGEPLPSPPSFAPTFELLPPAQSTITVNDLPQSWEVCSASLAEPPLIANATEMDDTAWITKESAHRRVEIFSPLSREDLKLSSLPGFTFTPSSPEPKTSDASTTPISFTLFHRVTPQSLPSHNITIIAPPEGSLPFGGIAKASTAPERDISRWEAAHPLMRYVQPHILSFPNDSVLECPQTSTAVISTPRGAILCAGEDGDTRYVFSAFELLPFEGKLNPTLSILTLNIFHWLSQAQAGDQFPSNVSGAAYILPAAMTLSPQELNSRTLAHPGVIRFQRAPEKQGDESAPSSPSFLRAHNVNAPEESDISRTTPLSLPPSSHAPPQDTLSTYPLAWWFALLAGMLLTGELIRRCIRSYSRRKA